MPACPRASQLFPTSSIGKTDRLPERVKTMELRHLRYFCAVADHGTFTEAGRRLHVSQSAISEQIADLEREIGGALLKRTSGRTRLTQHGQLFLAEARKTLLTADRALEITSRSLRGEV